MSSILKQNTSKRTTWAIWILTALITLLFTMSAVMKVLQVSMAVEGFTHMGIPQWAIVPLGIVELSCLALYLIPRTAVLGTFLLTGYLGGAVLANIIGHTDFIHAFAVGLAVWAGAWLRVPELRTLIPLRRSTEALDADDRREDGRQAGASAAGRSYPAGTR